MNFTILYAEYLVFALNLLHDFVQMVTIGIRNENLPELIARNQLHNLLHPRCIQLVEDIIQ